MSKKKSASKATKSTKKPAKKTSKKTPRNTSALAAKGRKNAGPMRNKSTSKKAKQKEKTLESALLSSEQDINMPTMHFDDLDMSEGEEDISIEVVQNDDEADDEFVL